LLSSGCETTELVGDNLLNQAIAIWHSSPSAI